MSGVIKIKKLCVSQSYFFRYNLLVAFIMILITWQFKTVLSLLLLLLLQLLKAHLDYKERTQLLASNDMMTDSTVTISTR